MHIFDKDGERRAEIRGPFTATLAVAHRKGISVRLFGRIHSDFYDTMLVSPFGDEDP
jgi:hypothetical protein